MNLWKLIRGIPATDQKAAAEVEIVTGDEPEAVTKFEYVPEDHDSIDAIDKSELYLWRIAPDGRKWYKRRLPEGDQ